MMVKLRGSLLALSSLVLESLATLLQFGFFVGSVGFSVSSTSSFSSSCCSLCYVSSFLMWFFTAEMKVLFCGFTW